MDIDKYFSTRRTVRRYSSREVEQDLLIKLLDEAAHAPNTGNMQLYSVIVTRSAEDKARLAPFHFNQPCATGCSVLLTFCIDINRFNLWCKANNADAAFDNVQMLTAAAIDTSLFAQQFNTLAEMNGLGCCYLGTTTYNASQIAEALNLPDGVVPLTTITVGYPEGDAPQSDRLQISAIVHEGAYHNYSEADIRAAYAEKEAQEESARFIKENNKETLAQVYAEVRYGRTNNEYFSTTWVDYLKAHYLKKEQ
jgi:nitroreductase